MKIVSNELTSPRQASDQNPSYTLSGTCCLRQSTIFIPHRPPLVKHKLQEKRTAAGHAFDFPFSVQGARAAKHATEHVVFCRGRQASAEVDLGDTNLHKGVLRTV